MNPLPKHLNYTTNLGIELARTATASWTPFNIHDSDYFNPLKTGIMKASIAPSADSTSIPPQAATKVAQHQTSRTTPFLKAIL